MAAKKKKVSVEFDEAVLTKLADAAAALSAIAAASITGADDPKVRAKLIKAAAKRK
jgi:hypothetical protein